MRNTLLLVAKFRVGFRNQLHGHGFEILFETFTAQQLLEWIERPINDPESCFIILFFSVELRQNIRRKQLKRETVGCRLLSVGES